jgi:hypothetical protein
MGEWRYSSLIHDHGIRLEVSVQLPSPVVLPLGNIPSTHCTGMMGGTLSRSGLHGEDKKIFCPHPESSPDSSVVQTVA